MAEQKFYVDINLKGNEIKQVVVERLAAAPSPLGIGHTYFDTTTNALTTWDGTSWITAGSNLGYTAEDQANKTDTIAGNTGSSVKFLSAKGVYDWVTGLAYQTVAGLSSAVLSILSSNASTARTNLGLGDSATKNVGTSAGTVAAGNDYGFTERNYDSMVDSNKTFTDGITLVYLATNLTAARTLTLPAANLYAIGTKVRFIDFSGSLTNSNTVTMLPNGSDSMNGITSFLVYSPYCVVEFETNGVDKWSGGVVSTGANGKYIDWTTVFTGFSADPTGVTTKYRPDGDGVQFMVDMTAGTSNATTLTFTLPLPASSSIPVQLIPVWVNIAGTGQTNVGWIKTRPGSTIADVYPTGAFGVWSGSAQFRAFRCANGRYLI